MTYSDYCYYKLRGMALRTPFEINNGTTHFFWEILKQVA